MPIIYNSGTILKRAKAITCAVYNRLNYNICLLMEATQAGVSLEPQTDLHTDVVNI